MKEGGGSDSEGSAAAGAVPPSIVGQSCVNNDQRDTFDYRTVNNDGPTRRVSSVEVKIGYAIVFE